MRVWKGLVSIILLAALVGEPAGAMAFNTRITVYASVPMMRNIYIDSNGYITKVAGNTDQNITPQVYNENNQLVSMTDSINSQYQQFLKQHDYKLEASKYYYLPVTITTLSDNLNISVGNGPSDLSLKL